MKKIMTTEELKIYEDLNLIEIRNILVCPYCTHEHKFVAIQSNAGIQFLNCLRCYRQILFTYDRKNVAVYNPYRRRELNEEK
jgi:transposase-like protein